MLENREPTFPTESSRRGNLSLRPSRVKQGHLSVRGLSQNDKKNILNGFVEILRLGPAVALFGRNFGWRSHKASPEADWFRINCLVWRFMPPQSTLLFTHPGPR